MTDSFWMHALEKHELDELEQMGLGSEAVYLNLRTKKLERYRLMEIHRGKGKRGGRARYEPIEEAP